MRTRPKPLLAELHAHTTWSDGELTVPELVDLVGIRGFDVLCVTDHVVRSDDPWLDAEPGELGVGHDSYDRYLDEIAREADRAAALYDLLVIPGLELTYNDAEPAQAAHAVAIGLHELVSVDEGIDVAACAAAELGAAVVAAHPYGREPAPVRSRLTQRWSLDAELRRRAHRFELFNRNQLFGWVADEGLSCVATGDVHTRMHVAGWKTLLPCGKSESSVVEYLRSARPVYLARVEELPDRLAA
jgi:hypothetical protein